MRSSVNTAFAQSAAAAPTTPQVCVRGVNSFESQSPTLWAQGCGEGALEDLDPNIDPDIDTNMHPMHPRIDTNMDPSIDPNGLLQDSPLCHLEEGSVEGARLLALPPLTESHRPRSPPVATVQREVAR